nr:NADH-quinone oxidoreductase subunit NuoE [uncultured Fretibacterium sp.]
MAVFTFDLEANREKIQAFRNFIDDNRSRKGVLMPVLQDAQSRFGYLPREVLEIVSKELRVPMSEVYGVATFYSQFTFIPKGRHDISVCLGTACYVKGVETVMQALERELGIKAGETTPDLQFSITPTRCLGACGIAPVIAIDGEQHGNLTPEKVKATLDKYR